MSARTHELRYGITIAAGEGVAIKEDAEFWSLPPNQAMEILIVAKTWLPFAADLEAIEHFKANDSGRFDLQVLRKGCSDAVLAMQRIDSNPLAGDEDREYAHVVLRALGPWSLDSAATREPKKRAGFVYLLSSDIGLFKIGKAKNVDKRLTRLSVKLPVKIEVIHVIGSNDYHWAEAYLHGMFAAKRDHGEWFKLSADDIKKIAEISRLDR